jgi:hypothetical protein
METGSKPIPIPQSPILHKTARTKQTARKSAGSMAPRKQLISTVAVSAAASVRKHPHASSARHKVKAALKARTGGGVATAPTSEAAEAAAAAAAELKVSLAAMHMD